MELYLEPWRAKAFPVIRDLVVEGPAALSVSTAAALRTPTPSRSPRRTPTSRWTPPSASAAAPKEAQCPNASTALFVSAKVSQFALLPQGQPERYIRVLKMVEQMERECEAACPKEISLNNIARMNRDQIVAKVTAGS